MKDPVKINLFKYGERGKALKGLSYMNSISQGSWLKYPCFSSIREPCQPDDAGLWKGEGLDISNLGVRIVRSR